MNVLNKKFIQFAIIFVYFFLNCNCLEEIINSSDLDEVTQCFNRESITFGEKEEISYEIINNNLEKTLFIQFKSVEAINIYHSEPSLLNTLFSTTKDDINFGNFYFTMDKNIDKYYINIELTQTDLPNFKICFNLFEGKGNSFKTYPDKSQKISNYEIINSGNYPFYIKDNLNSFNALRINKIYENFFSFSYFSINAYIEDSEEVISIHNTELYNKGDYYYLIFYLDINNSQKLKDIVIEMNLNLLENEDKNFKFEIELVNTQEIYYEYKLVLKNEENIDIPNKIYYIDLRKYLFKLDLDILFLTNNLDNGVFISNSDNINNENILLIDKKFISINKYLFKKEIYKELNPYLLLIIVDESFHFTPNENIFYNFIFAESSHNIYNYQEDITKDELFNENNKILIKSNTCHTSYYINYFTDIEKQKILEYESLMGNAKLYYSKKNDLSNEITDYLSEIDSYPIEKIENSILSGEYGIFKRNCLNGSERILSYIYIYNKNTLEDIIDFVNQKALLYIEKAKEYSFIFDEKLKDEKFNFRLRLLKKEEGECNLEIKYDNNIYNSLKEENFIELKHEANSDSIINIALNKYNDIDNKSINSLIIEIIKEIDIEKNLIKIQKSNVENSILQPMKYVFFEYMQKSSTQIKINLKNEDNENVNICIHKGYGVYPYLIKPTCNADEYINLKRGEEINLIYDNPYILPLIENINNNDNPLYISIYTDNTIKFSYNYEKYSIFILGAGYKDIDFNGKEIIQLGNNNEYYPSIYYQINLCQDFKGNIQDYLFKKSIFNYHFDIKENSEINEINSNIYKEYELHSNNPKIIFNSDGILKAKFKYIYDDKNRLNFNENYSKNIGVEQNKTTLKVSVDSPFYGDIILNIIMMTSNFEKYNGYCELIELYENIESNEDMMLYGQKYIQRQIYVEEGSNIVNIEIELEQLADLNRKNAKIFVINTLKEINIDTFYTPIDVYIDFNDNSELELKKEMTKNIIIAIVCFTAICILFYLFRNCHNKDSKEINYENKSLRLNNETINESNKLFS